MLFLILIICLFHFFTNFPMELNEVQKKKIKPLVAATYLFGKQKGNEAYLPVVKKVLKKFKMENEDKYNQLYLLFATNRTLLPSDMYNEPDTSENDVDIGDTINDKALLENFNYEVFKAIASNKQKQLNHARNKRNFSCCCLCSTSALSFIVLTGLLLPLYMHCF